MNILYYDIKTNEFTNLTKELLESSNEYKNKRNKDECFFSSEEFHELHMKNAEDVYKIIIKNKNSLLVEFYFGIKNNKMLLPYSSPFFYFNEFKKIRDEEYLKISEAIKKLKLKLKLKELKILFTPRIYNERVENIVGIFLNNGYKMTFNEINHYFDLKSEIIMDRSVKKDINLAKKAHLIFKKSTLNETYPIIKQNRDEKGFPLRMSKDHLNDIEKLSNSKIDNFLIVDEFNKKLAAAIVFKIKDKKYQVVYWGNIKEDSNKKPMSLLIENLINYYKEKCDILDIGPSSEHGIINFGLSQFKQNIGCKVCNKIMLQF